MRIRDALGLSVKYTLRYRRRYFFLFCALSFGFCVVTVIMSVKEGMARNMYFSALGHYAGDLVLTGYDKDSGIHARISPEYLRTIRASIAELSPAPETMVFRTQYFSDASVFHNGESALLKYLYGVDWENETAYLRALLGLGAEADVSFSEHSILLSAPVAQKINARAGDSIILEIENRYHQRDTAAFVVAGVFEDNSIFGFYKSFVSRQALNALVAFAPEDCSVIGLRFRGGEAQAAKARPVLQERLEREQRSGGAMQISAPAATRAEWDAERDKDWRGVMVFLLALSVYLTGVTNILQALNAISFLLYIMMMIIVFVSAAVTYRLIFHERTKELATMRAIGFGEGDIVLILTLETVYLATISLAAGFILALGVNAALTTLPFDWFPGLDMFLKNGRLSSVYKAASTGFNAAVIYIMLLVSVSVPARALSRAPLSRMLGGSMKE